MASSQPRKKTRGRRKINMQLIEDENSRRITLSKRRGGLFKKATELSTLCGAQIALIIFSLGGKAYSFGHPSVESVADQYFNGSRRRRFVPPRTRLQDLKEYCDQITEELKVQKKRGRDLEDALESCPNRISVEHLARMNLLQLKQQKGMMENLRVKLRHMVTRFDLNSMEKTSSENVDLAKVEQDGQGSSPIPIDWLKL